MPPPLLATAASSRRTRTASIPSRGRTDRRSSGGSGSLPGTSLPPSTAATRSALRPRHFLDQPPVSSQRRSRHDRTKRYHHGVRTRFAAEASSLSEDEVM